jgi:hypothetical protein
MKQLLCVVDLNAGRIGALLIRRVANRFLRQESQIILGEPRGYLRELS